MKPLIFTLGGNDQLANEISKLIGIEISPDNVTHFSDGETFARPDVDVDGKDCYIIHSIARPVNERLMDLLIFLDGLHNGGAKHVTVLMPYFGYARQDREIKRGDPISGYLVVRLLQTVHVDEIVCIDFHSKRLFERFTLEKTNMTAVDLLAKAIKKELEEKGICEDICVISPDKSGVDRAERFSKMFDHPSIAYASKYRPKPNEACLQELHGDVKGKNCIVVDDICDTGGTLCEALKEIKKQGAKSIYVAITHGIFSGHAKQKINALHIDGFYITNSIECDYSEIERLHVVSVADILANFLKPRFE